MRTIKLIPSSMTGAVPKVTQEGLKLEKPKKLSSAELKARAEARQYDEFVAKYEAAKGGS